MKIYFFNARKYIKYVLFLIVAIILISITGIIGTRVVGVYSSTRDLPIYLVESQSKTAAITFDCAWGAGDIPNILETLKKEEVKASFFMVGQWAEKFPDTVKMIAAQGHDIANHGYSHLRMGALDKEKIKSEIELCNQKLSEISGNKIDLFRAPYGDYSNNVVGVARSLGCFTIQWNVDSLDWKPEISQEEILNRITKRIVPGSIILFHNDTPHTSNILPTIITTLKEQGYSFLPVSEMIIRDKYYIDHEGKQKLKE